MNNYGYEVINCSKLDNQFIKKINTSNYQNKRKKLVIQVKNTQNIDKKSLLYLNTIKNKYNLDIKISILEPYIPNENDHEITKERYFYNTLYDIEELSKIINELEKIESLIDPQWNQFDIVIYLIETIVRNIMYDPEYILMKNKGIQIPKVIGEQDEADYFDRSLRGILTKKAVCGGYALIFNELAKRNGIDCKYVSGSAYTIDGKYQGGHAWNIIKINGVKYPLDITWKNKKYRSGDFGNIEDISCDIEKFRKRHKPYDKQDDIGLTQLDENIIKKSKEKISIRKHYNATTYIFQRTDGSKFILSQIGIYKGIFRYLYSEINKDGNYEIPQIVFSSSNFVQEYEDNKFERNDHYNEFKDAFINVLFSKQNLNDSIIKKKTKYIGGCELINRKGYIKNISEIIKSDRAIKVFGVDNIKSQKRTDGSILTLVQIPNRLNENFKYIYYVYILYKGPKVIEYRIYSNDNYFSMKSTTVVNSILSNKNLESALKNKGIIR